jgi:hypothetical protein
MEGSGETAVAMVGGAPPEVERPRAPSRLKPATLALVVLALGALVGWAVVRESAAPAPAPAVATRPAELPPRPAPTAAEEVFARALWTIHGEVKTATFGLTLAGMKFKLRELDRTELGARVRAADRAYRDAEARTGQLPSPPSLAEVRAGYLEAVRLLRSSAAEMAKTAEDGRDEHLVAAFPLSQEASRRLLEVGKVIWPGEYVPN